MDDRGPAPRILESATVRSALIFVFCGLIVVFIDVTIAVSGASGFHGVDVLNDVVGYGLIAWGQLRLMGQPGPPTYGATIRVALVVTLIELVWSLIVQIAPLGTFGTLPSLALTLLDLVGWLVFIVAMRELSRSNGLTASSAYWGLTFKIASAMWGALAVLVVAIVAILSGAGIGSLGWLRAVVLLGLPLALVPSSTSGAPSCAFGRSWAAPPRRAPADASSSSWGRSSSACWACSSSPSGSAGRSSDGSSRLSPEAARPAAAVGTIRPCRASTRSRASSSAR